MRGISSAVRSSSPAAPGTAPPPVTPAFWTSTTSRAWYAGDGGDRGDGSAVSVMEAIVSGGAFVFHGISRGLAFAGGRTAEGLRRPGPALDQGMTRHSHVIAHSEHTPGNIERLTSIEST